MIDKTFIKKIHTQQHDVADCGPACLLSVLKYYGGNSTIDTLRNASGTSKTGTSLLGLCEAARKLGFEAQGATANNIDELIAVDKPCILVVTLDKMSHYVVCYGYEEGCFIIGDSGRGVIQWTPEELKDVWTYNCLLLEPTDRIIKDELIKKKKKRWIQDLVKEDYHLLIFSLLLGILLSILGLSMSIFSQKLVDVILPSKNYELLTVGLVLLFVVTCSSIVLTSLRSKIILIQSQRFNNRSIRFFFEKLLHLPKSFFDSHKRGDMITRLGDTRRVQSVISSIFNDYIISALMLISTTIFLFFYSWKIALLVILTAPVCFWVIFRKNKTIMNLQRDVMIAYAICESGFINTFEGISYIKSYLKQNDFLDINCLNYEWMQKKALQLGEEGISIGVQSGIINAIIQIGMIAFGSFLVFGDQLSIGELMAIISVSGVFFSAVNKMAVVIIPINEAKVAFERMFEFANTPTEQSNHNMIDAVENKVEGLSVDKLSFRFVGRKLLLNEVTFSANTNEITCIVGESGCGKSTLCQLLEQFYTPTSGHICYNGSNISDYSLEEWRKMVTYIPQDMYILNGTILDNICFGSKPENIESVLNYCNHYGFTEFFKDLPGGLFTIVGEEGINLSGGQKQILAMARALYSSKPIIILDEITSAMDRHTESFICSLLTRIKENKIILFVSHRLETVRKIGDKIIVLENGSLSAQGSHDEVMNSDNFYSSYWNTLIN